MIVPILNPLRFYAPNGSKVKENNPFFLSQNYWNELNGSYQPKFQDKLECIAYEDALGGVYGFSDIAEFIGSPTDPRIENCKFCFDGGNAIYTNLDGATIGKVLIVKYSGTIDIEVRENTTVIHSFTGLTDGLFIHDLDQNYTNLTINIEVSATACILGAMVVEPFLDYTTCDGDFEAEVIDICSYGGVYLMQIEEIVSCCKITIGDYESEFFSIISQEDKEFLKLQKVSYLSYFMDKDMAFSDLWEAHILVESKLIYTKGSDKEIFEGQNRNTILDDKALRLRIFRSGAIPYYLAEQLDLIFGFNLNIDGVNYVAHEQTEIEEITGNTDLFNFECILRAQDFDLNAANSLYSQAIIAFKNATLKVNGGVIKSLSSGETWELKVKVDGIESGTFDGTDTWEISSGGTCLDANYNLKDTLGNTLSSGTIASGSTSNIVAPNADYTLKDTSGTTLSSGSIESDGSDDIVAPDASYLVEYANGTDIQSGNIKSGSSLTITVPNPPTMQGAMPLKTGQTTSYQTGDDAFLQEGRLVNFTTLDFNNVFGNTTRFTDELGGQTYTNRIVIDHATKACNSNEHLAFYIGDANTTRTHAQAVTWGLAVSVGIYTSGWFLSNINQLLFICNFVTTSWINYAPFNHTTGLWSSSRYSTQGLALFPQIPTIQTQSVNTSYRTFACRIMTWNGTSFI